MEGEVGEVFGLGLNKLNGGKLRWVELYGEGNLANKMLEFEKKYGEKFRK
jgi:hypothetical protein